MTEKQANNLDSIDLPSPITFTDAERLTFMLSFQQRHFQVYDTYKLSVHYSPARETAIQAFAAAFITLSLEGTGQDLFISN